ncbi:FG-GAP repeat protein, partial [Candidatus Poribacteria bacterium]|nr:FG-GAP repeat protein [Candidatus Poribacteria bacterium]
MIPFGPCRNLLRTIFVLAALALASTQAAAQGLSTDVGEPHNGQQRVYLSAPKGGQRGEPLRTGDFNGDGFRDVAIAAFYADLANGLGTPIRSHNGLVEVVFGDGRIQSDINLFDYDGPRLQIHGARDSSILGLELAARDVDDDGLDDLVLGAAQGVYKDLPNATGAGEVVVLFGRPEWGGAVRELDLADLPDGQRAQFFVGQRQLDRLASWVYAEDLDKDGNMDITMAMDQHDGVDGTRNNSGGLVIYWGEEGERTPFVRVGDSPTSSLLTIIYGVDPLDLMGATHWVSDWDGDDHWDLAVAAGVNRSGLQRVNELQYSAAGGGDGPLNNRSNCGEVTIFWDAGTLHSHRLLDLRQPLPPDVDTTILYGSVSGGFFGEEINAGDVNGDGIQDLLVGALTIANVGWGYVFWGGPELRARTTYDLQSAANSGVYLRVVGYWPFGIAADTLNAFDVNSDGIDDLFWSSPQASFPEGRANNGLVHVIYGTPALRQDFQTLNLSDFELGVENGLLWTRLYAPDGGDLFAYSASLGDMDSDGVLDYAVNAMQGDGFQ